MRIYPNQYWQNKMFTSHLIRDRIMWICFIFWINRIAPQSEIIILDVMHANLPTKWTRSDGRLIKQVIYLKHQHYSTVIITLIIISIKFLICVSLKQVQSTKALAKFCTYISICTFYFDITVYIRRRSLAPDKVRVSTPLPAFSALVTFASIIMSWQ